MATPAVTAIINAILTSWKNRSKDVNVFFSDVAVLFNYNITFTSTQTVGTTASNITYDYTNVINNNTFLPRQLPQQIGLQDANQVLELLTSTIDTNNNTILTTLSTLIGPWESSCKPALILIGYIFDFLIDLIKNYPSYETDIFNVLNAQIANNSTLFLILCQRASCDDFSPIITQYIQLINYFSQDHICSLLCHNQYPDVTSGGTITTLAALNPIASPAITTASQSQYGTHGLWYACIFKYSTVVSKNIVTILSAFNQLTPEQFWNIMIKTNKAYINCFYNFICNFFLADYWPQTSEVASLIPHAIDAKYMIPLNGDGSEDTIYNEDAIKTFDIFMTLIRNMLPDDGALKSISKDTTIPITQYYIAQLINSPTDILVFPYGISGMNVLYAAISRLFIVNTASASLTYSSNPFYLYIIKAIMNLISDYFESNTSYINTFVGSTTLNGQNQTTATFQLSNIFLDPSFTKYFTQDNAVWANRLGIQSNTWPFYNSFVTTIAANLESSYHNPLQPINWIDQFTTIQKAICPSTDLSLAKITSNDSFEKLIEAYNHTLNTIGFGPHGYNAYASIIENIYNFKDKSSDQDVLSGNLFYINSRYLFQYNLMDTFYTICNFLTCSATLYVINGSTTFQNNYYNYIIKLTQTLDTQGVAQDFGVFFSILNQNLVPTGVDSVYENICNSMFGIIQGSQNGIAFFSSNRLVEFLTTIDRNTNESMVITIFRQNNASNISTILKMIKLLSIDQQEVVLTSVCMGRSALWYALFNKNMTIPSTETNTNIKTLYDIIKTFSPTGIASIFLQKDIVYNVTPLMWLYYHVSSTTNGTVTTNNIVAVGTDILKVIPATTPPSAQNPNLALWTTLTNDLFLLVYQTCNAAQKNNLALLCMESIRANSVSASVLKTQTKAHYDGKNILIWMCDLGFDELICNYLQELYNNNTSFLTTFFSSIVTPNMCCILKLTYVDSAGKKYLASDRAALQPNMIHKNTVTQLLIATGNKIFSWQARHWTFLITFLIACIFSCVIFIVLMGTRTQTTLNNINIHNIAKKIK